MYMYDFFYELLYNQIKMFYDVYDGVVGYVFKKPVLPLIPPSAEVLNAKHLG